jgi:anti-anti-sigma factor
LSRAVDLAPGDHVAWAYDDLASLRAVCADTFAEGASRGEQLVYLGHRPLGHLVDDLAGLEGRDALIRSGQLTVHAVEYAGSHSSGLDADAQVASWRSSAEAAVESGYSGLRVVGDITEEVADPDCLGDLLECELAVDAMYAAAPALALCVFDRTRTGSRWREVSALHRIQHIPGAEGGFALTLANGVVRLIGEVDLSSVDEFAHLLGAAAQATTGPLEVDLAGLDFIDVAASRALARARTSMRGAGRELLVTGARHAAALPLREFRLFEGATR